MFSHLLIACAFLHIAWSFTFPAVVPLEKRQQPGTPQYECHENCGSVITSARAENFCDSANFTTTLDACLNCADEYNIWQYYGESVGAAAQSCGLEAIPVAANSTSASSTSTATTGMTSSSESATTTNESSLASETTQSADLSSAASTASQQASSATSEGAAAATSANGVPELRRPSILGSCIMAVVAMWL